MKLVANCTDALTDAEVGGKFAKQAQMRRAGLPVPEFFCLTSEFYRQASRAIRPAIARALADLDFSDQHAVRAASEEIARQFAALELLASHRDAILSAFDSAFAADSLVSVRASTVGHLLEESEDSADNPFAGMSESWLYVRRDDVLDKIRGCWASGFSPESLIYRNAQNMDVLGFDVAVGVQQMVFGERSFVLFTADPKTSARDPVLVAGHGIGEGVVQERVAVDHYFVSRKGGEIRRDIAEKLTQLTVNASDGYGLCEQPVPAEKVTAACLSDDEVRRVVEFGDKIERLFGAPQDIEGTLTADGSIHILQSRPIAIDYRRQLVWSNTNVTESYPGVTTALTYTHAKYFYRVIFRDLYRRLGVDPDTLHENFEPLDRMIGFLHGRVYYCLTHFYKLHSLSPLFPIFRSHWENMIGLSSSYQTHEATGVKAAFDRARATARFGRALAQVAADYARHDRAMERYHAWWDARVEPWRGQDMTGEDPYQLVSRFRAMWAEVGRHWGVTLTTDAYLIPLYGLAEHLFAKWGLDEDPSLLSDLLCGDEELLSVEIVLSVVALAEKVRRDDALGKFFAERDGETIWNAVRKNELSDEFRDAVERHLHRFGDRGLQELKMEQPALRDTPWVLMTMVKQYAVQDISVQSMRDNELKVRREADQRLRERLGSSPAKLALLTRVILPRLRRLIRHRENSRYCRSELFGFSRNVFRALGHYLVAKGALRDAESIYHLSQEEVFGYVDGTGFTSDLQALADIRRAEFEAHQNTTTREHVTTLGAVPDNAVTVSSDADRSNHNGDELRGLGSSAGRVTGTARVVLDPNSVSEFGDDMILVAKETDPGWLFLMLAAKGIVVERGSMLSHTAITGRKFGIPAIVALPGATDRIPDGATIEMDGSSGCVTLLDES